MSADRPTERAPEPRDARDAGGRAAPAPGAERGEPARAGSGEPEGAPPPAGVSGAPIEIILDADGNVIFTDLPPELQEILDELNPDAPRSTVCLVPSKDP
jgi:hypothetical protein